jgi:hypothetical protein
VLIVKLPDILGESDKPIVIFLSTLSPTILILLPDLKFNISVLEEANIKVEFTLMVAKELADEPLSMEEITPKEFL